MVAEDGGEAYVPRLRVEARREYLKKREPQQLKLLRAAIHDEEFLFKGVELSKAEQMERELNKQILAAAERRVNLTDKVEGYQMPEDEFDERGKLNKDSQLDKLRARYTAPDNEVFVIDAEQKEWEEAQMQRVATNYGSKDAAAAAAANAASSYDYVFDAQIDFVRDLTAQQLERDDADADATNDSKPPRTAAEAAQKEHASLQETRRSLPIFQYRDELIKAVQDHQVSRNSLSINLGLQLANVCVRSLLGTDHCR
jgi:pre-mRNA-splicing factor ATP-dependent RNA helicase DHX16